MSYCKANQGIMRVSVWRKPTLSSLGDLSEKGAQISLERQVYICPRQEIRRVKGKYPESREEYLQWSICESDHGIFKEHWK